MFQGHSNTVLTIVLLCKWVSSVALPIGHGVLFAPHSFGQTQLHPYYKTNKRKQQTCAAWLQEPNTYTHLQVGPVGAAILVRGNKMAAPLATNEMANVTARTGHTFPAKWWQQHCAHMVGWTVRKLVLRWMGWKRTEGMKSQGPFTNKMRRSSFGWRRQSGSFCQFAGSLWCVRSSCEQQSNAFRLQRVWSGNLYNSKIISSFKRKLAHIARYLTAFADVS